MPVRSDGELLRATPDSAAAFAEFYRRHERTVGAYFMSRVKNAELAADLTSETFAAAFVGVRRFPPEVAPIAWLLGIARNLWLRSLHHRQVEDRARRKLGLRVEFADDVLERFEQLAGDQIAVQLLDDLPAEQAAAVRQRVIDDASYDQIARDLRCSPSVARQRVSRGLRALRTRQEPS